MSRRARMTVLRNPRRARSDYADGVVTDAQQAANERVWLLRALLVLQSPREVFAALRDDSEDAARARSEPIVALVWLAGIACVLATPVAGRVLDDVEFDSLLIAVYHVLHDHVPYRELGAAHFDRLAPTQLTRYLVKRLERLGHKVTLEPIDVAA